MPKKKPTKTSALAGAVETDIQAIKKTTSTSDVPQVQSVQVQEPKNERGKRGSDDYVQLCVHIPKALRVPFRVAVAEADSDNSKFIEMLIREHIEKNST